MKTKQLLEELADLLERDTSNAADKMIKGIQSKEREKVRGDDDHQLGNRAKAKAGRSKSSGKAIHNVKGQSGEFYAGKGANDPKGDVTAVGDQGPPYMSRCMCYGGKKQRLKMVKISCGYKKAYNKRYKDKNPHSGWKPVGKKKKED